MCTIHSASVSPPPPSRCPGLCFRLRIFQDKELGLHRLHDDEVQTIRLQARAQYYRSRGRHFDMPSATQLMTVPKGRFEVAHVDYPAHAAAIRALALRFPAFSGAVRLVQPCSTAAFSCLVAASPVFSPLLPAAFSLFFTAFLR